MSMFANKNDKSSFNIQEVEQVEVPKEFLDEVFSILSDTTKKDFVQYRLDLLTEASKANPSFVEVQALVNSKPYISSQLFSKII